jgi:hypothetical protein
MKKNVLHFLLVLTTTFALAQDKQDVFEIARKGTVTELGALLKVNPKEVNAVNADGYSPLILACYRSNNEVAKMLIDNGADINYQSGLGTPLMSCAVKGNNEIAKILIERKANIDAKDANGITAILYATMFKNHELATLLVKANANLDAKDNRGNTPLDYAILADDDKLIEILKSK